MSEVGMPTKLSSWTRMRKDFDWLELKRPHQKAEPIADPPMHTHSAEVQGIKFASSSAQDDLQSLYIIMYQK